MRKIQSNLLGVICLVLATMFVSSALAKDVLKPEEVFNLTFATTAEISPDGKWIAYTVSVQREVTEKAGGRYSELHLVSTETGASRPFVVGKVNVSSPRWSPDGKQIAFLTRRGEKAKTQVWAIPVDGGEATPVTDSKTGVSEFRWHPTGEQIAYITTEPKSEREKTLDEKGYGFIFYEENLKHRNLYIVDVGPTGKEVEAE